MRISEGIHTYRTYIKPREYGDFIWRIWHCNTVDSTWDEGLLSRENDAATDGAWLYKAKQTDEVIICLGVNDIGILNRNYEEIIMDLTTIVNKLKGDRPLLKIILCTVPPF